MYTMEGDGYGGSAFRAARATEKQSSGKYYFELLISEVTYGGYATTYVGIGKSAAPLSFPGTDNNGYGYYGYNGKKYYNGSGYTYGGKFQQGDIIGIAVDLDNGKIWFALNGVWQDSGNPTLGTGYAFSGLSGEFFPMAGIYSGYDHHQTVRGRFAATDFTYSLPELFSAWEPILGEASAGAGVQAQAAVIYEPHRSGAADVGVSVGAEGKLVNEVYGNLGLEAEADAFNLTSRLEAGVGIEFQASAFNLTDEVTPGAGIQALADADGEFPKTVFPEVGIGVAVDADGEFPKDATAGVGIGATASAFNWVEWLKIFGNRYTARYYFTLTGAPDGTTDLTIPIKSFQFRLRSGTPSYLAVYIAGVDHAAAIALRQNGEMVLEMAYLVSGVEQHREILAMVDLETIRIDEGDKNKSISLVGHRTETWFAQKAKLAGATYFAEYNGKRRVRLAAPDLFLRPGDEVTVHDETFTVGQISSSVSPAVQWTEVVEA